MDNNKENFYNDIESLVKDDTKIPKKKKKNIVLDIFCAFFVGLFGIFIVSFFLSHTDKEWLEFAFSWIGVLVGMIVGRNRKLYNHNKIYGIIAIVIYFVTFVWGFGLYVDIIIGGSNVLGMNPISFIISYSFSSIRSFFVMLCGVVGSYLGACGEFNEN